MERSRGLTERLCGEGETMACERSERGVKEEGKVSVKMKRRQKVLVLKNKKNITFNDNSVKTVVETPLLTTVVVRIVVVSSCAHL